MHQNPIWLSFLGLLGLVTVFFLGEAAWEYSTYRSQNQVAPAQVSDWQVVQVGRDRYALAPTFRFHYQQQDWEVSEVWEGQTHRNRWSAEQTAEANTKRDWQAHFNSRKPKEATLLHSFPWKSILSALALAGLLCYFIGLGYYVGKMTH